MGVDGGYYGRGQVAQGQCAKRTMMDVRQAPGCQEVETEKLPRGWSGKDSILTAGRRSTTTISHAYHIRGMNMESIWRRGQGGK